MSIFQGSMMVEEPKATSGKPLPTIYSGAQIFGIALALYPAAPLFLVGQNFRAVRMPAAAALSYAVFVAVSLLFNVYYEDVLAWASGSVLLAVAAFYAANVLPALLLHRLFRAKAPPRAGSPPRHAKAVVIALAATALSFAAPAAFKVASHTCSVWLTRQGAAQEQAGDAAGAEALYARSAGLALLFRHYDLASAHYTGLGSRLLKAGDSDAALAALDAAEAYARRSGSAYCEKIALRGKSECFLARKDYAGALAFTLASSRVDGGPEFAGDYAPEQVRIGALYLKIGKPAEAVGPLQRAQAAYRRLGIKQDLAVASAFLGSAYAGLGQPEPARREYQAALQLYEELGSLKMAGHLRRVMRGEQPLGFGVP